MTCCSADTYGEFWPGECPAEEKTVSEDVGVGYADTVPLCPDEKAGKMAERPGRRKSSLLPSDMAVAQYSWG